MAWGVLAQWALCHCLPRPRAVPATGTHWASLPRWRQAWMGAHGDNSRVTHTGPLWGHGEEQCCQLPQHLPTPNTCTCVCGGCPCVVSLPHASPWGGRRAEPLGRGTPSPQHHTQHQPRPAYPGDAPAGRRAEPCPRMPWMKVGGSAWAGPCLLPQTPPALQSGLQHPWVPPLHPWGARRAGFALALQMVVGAVGAHWGPWQRPSTGQPGGGGGLEILSAGEQGRSRPRSPCISPRPPSRHRLRPALISAAPGSWEKMTPNYHGNKTCGDGAGAMLVQPPPAGPHNGSGCGGSCRLHPGGSITARWPPRFRASPGSIRRGPQHPGVPGAGLGEQGCSAQPRRRPPSSACGFPASSGLGFNYLNCNATGEREAGNPSGDVPVAPLCHRLAGEGVPGLGGTPHPEENLPGLLGQGG